MKSYKLIQVSVFAAFVFCLVISSCQKMHRPELKEIILDPEPPPYEPLKSFWAFENNLNDEGENKLSGEQVNTSYVAGTKGQALQIGENGYLLLPVIGDTVRYPNEFVGVPADTIRSLGSATISFWMNGAAGPVQDGAQGIFSISNKTQFWGNFDIFLENYSDPDDANAVWMKMHMFNAGAPNGTGEEWIADDDVKFKNVLGKWTHIAVVYDSATSQISVYKDGAATAVANRTLGGGSYGKLRYNDFNGIVLGTFAFQTTPPLAGAEAQGWAKSFNGAIDQVRIYNKALSAGEIMQLFTSQE